MQKKLAISEPGDIYEQEADRIAGEVIATPVVPSVGDASSRIRRFAGQTTGQMDAAPDREKWGQDYSLQRNRWGQTRLKIDRSRKVTWR